MKQNNSAELLTKRTATALEKLSGEVRASLDGNSRPGSLEGAEEFAFGLTLF